MQTNLQNTLCGLNSACDEELCLPKTVRKIAAAALAVSLHAEKDDDDFAKTDMALFCFINDYVKNCIDTKKELALNFSEYSFFADLSGAKYRNYCLKELLTLVVFANERLITPETAARNLQAEQIKASSIKLGLKIAEGILSPVKYDAGKTASRKSIFKKYILPIEEKTEILDICNKLNSQLNCPLPVDFGDLKSILPQEERSAVQKSTSDNNGYKNWGYYAVWSFCASVISLVLISLNSAFLFIMLFFDLMSLLFLSFYIFERAKRKIIGRRKSKRR